MKWKRILGLADISGGYAVAKDIWKDFTPEGVAKVLENRENRLDRAAFLKEQLVYLYEFGGIGRPPQVTVSMMNLSQANVNFSGVNEKLRSVQVGFRLLEDNETLEVTVFDYEPTDFLYNTYRDLAAWSGEGEFPMEMHMIRYHFTKVK